MREFVRDRDRLEHIVEAIDNILNYSNSKTQEELESDKLRYYGIVKNIEIIGETAYKLTKVFRLQHSDTPWEFITKMRHVLAHDYYRIKPVEVWKVIQEDLHPLREQVARYIDDTDWDAWEKNEVAITETAISKNNESTARLMKIKGYPVKDIAEITGLSVEDVEML